MNSKFPLSQRLQAIYSLIPPEGECFWDIGCDHGYLGMNVGIHKSYQTVCLVDPSEEVHTKLSILDADIPKGKDFKLIKEKGENLKVRTHSNVFVLCGFGGKQILKAIQSLSKQLSSPSLFILSPHRDMGPIREWLHKMNWSLHHEEIVTEQDQFYEILAVSNQEGPKISLYGEAQWRSVEGASYRENLLKILANHRNVKDQAFRSYLITTLNS
ncbi:MAG: class I SAM-dependent methyltransferase [Bacteriovoracaceae bacterium]|nr:class I SAM-dependent methyltransferase [Bacteriovoracaceae bacterium]